MTTDRNRKPVNEIPSFRLGGQERNFLLVEVSARSHPDCNDFWDGNWLASSIRVQAGAFAGRYHADLRSEEFAEFFNSLRLMYTSLRSQTSASVVEFVTTEEQLSIVIRGDALGHFTAKCIAVDDAGVGNRLEFELAFDQTEVPAILRGLETIIEAFPVLGAT